MQIPNSLLQRLVSAVAVSLAALGSASAWAYGTDVGVSVSISQPGFYGRVDIGDRPPVLLYPQPVIIQPSPHGQRMRPIYMRVPPGHSKDWKRHCSRYGACGQPVYFVRDDGAPPRRGPHDHDHAHDHDHGHDHDRGHGKGHGHGRGHGKGRD